MLEYIIINARNRKMEKKRFFDKESAVKFAKKKSKKTNARFDIYKWNDTFYIHEGKPIPSKHAKKG